jgi:lipoprotein-releasing system permease protein
MPFELQIALRYLVAKRKQAFISVISVASIIGVTVGVMALVIALALMTGLQQEVRDRILGSSPHMYVSRVGGFKDYKAEVDKLRAVPDVVGAAPGIMGKALITSETGESFITLKGVDPALESSVTDIGRAMISGSLDALAGHGEEDVSAILLGKDLAGMLGVKVGDPVRLLTPKGTLSPMGMVPRTKRLVVGGVFGLGLYEFDAQWGYVALDVAERMLDKERADFIQVRVGDMYDAPRIAAQLPDRIGADYIVQDWADMNQSLFSALSLEKMAISLTIGLIGVVAALNILASLILLVMEKNRDIAILKTMGASARSVTLIFMAQGLIIGIIGTTVGGGLGYLVSSIADRYRLVRIPYDVYQVSHVPFVVMPFDFVAVVVGAILICFFATLYPSRQAARLDPAQALR